MKRKKGLSRNGIIGSVPPAKKNRGRPKVDKPKATEKKAGKVCEICGATVSCLKTHLILHLPISQRKRVPCKFCNKTFSSYSGRGRHVRTKHLCVIQTCPKCNKSVKDLAAHDLRTHNREALPLECSMCQQRYSIPSQLAQHMSVHTRAHQYMCSDCGSTFRLKVSMQHHKRRVHEKEKSYLCDFCSKGFFNKYTLGIHLRMHTDERPLQCGECGKWFRTRSQLKVHLRRHRDQRDYPCTLCSLAFFTSGALKTHMISHTKAKHYKCGYCDTSFGRSDHRNRHQRTAHPNELQSGNTTRTKSDSNALSQLRRSKT